MLSIDSPRCEYRINPLGMDIRQPRLSWTINSDARGEIQTAYQILVASAPEILFLDQGDLWNSGKVSSAQQNQLEYSGLPLGSRMRCHWKVRIWDGNGRISDWSQPAWWTMGLLDPTEWKAQWIGLEEPLVSKPAKSNSFNPKADDYPKLLSSPRYLRKEFIIHGKIKRATAYATALGLYELRLNGQKVGDQLLAPEWTNYHRRVQVQTYDLTSLLKAGLNTVGAVLGNGWFSGMFQNWPCAVRIYGDEPLFLAQIEIDFADGSSETIISDSSWQGSLEGPLRFSGIYEGETYDARREMPGWDYGVFNGKDWKPVKAVKNSGAGKLVWQRGEAIRVSREIRPVTVTEPKPGVYVFAFDQNMVGWTRFTGKAEAGTTVELQHGEMLNSEGTVFTENLRVVCQQHQSQLDRYIFRGNEEETFEPRFTYHGFQYVEVRGLKQKPGLEALVGVVFHSSCTETGTFHCSEPLLERLAQNILWSQRGNFMGIPTDCPQRNERCGYTGDAQFFIRTAVYNMDIAAFFNKWLTDVCEDSQLPGGWFADHAPHYCEPGSGPNIGWSDAGIICPYEIYRTYGDTRIIREHYPAMKRKLDWLARESRDYLFKGHVGNGDWLNLGGGVHPEVLGTAYAAFDFRIMAEMAEAIGETRDAARFRDHAAKITAAFAQAYFDPEGRLYESSQSGYALAFTMDLVPATLKEKASSHFLEELRRFDWHPATGFIGTPCLLPGLHRADADDAAYRLLLTKTSPSWLYPVSIGATTIWEHWDSYDGQIPKGGMNSLNHYAFGSVGEYLFAQVGGIQCEIPGYEQIRIEPVIRPGLTWAKTTYQSMRGPIATAWKIDNGQLEIALTIPANTSATVVIPSTRSDEITESGRPAKSAHGVLFLRRENTSVIFRVGSGQYHFTTPLPDYLLVRAPLV